MKKKMKTILQITVIIILTIIMSPSIILSFFYELFKLGLDAGKDIFEKISDWMTDVDELDKELED